MNASDPHPFLLLFSPNVGRSGHAYVHSPDRPDVTSAQAQAAKKSVETPLKVDTIALGVKKVVIQEDTNRGAKQWLICAGAIPENDTDYEVVTNLLSELMEQHIHVEWLKNASHSNGLLHTSHEMADLEATFFSHLDIRKIRWRRLPSDPAVASPIPNGVSQGRFMSARRMLGIFVILIVGGPALFMALKGDNGDALRNGDSADPAKEKPTNSVDWTFLETAAWQRVLKATGGSRVLSSKDSDATEEAVDSEACSEWATTLLAEFEISNTVESSLPSQLKIFERLIGEAHRISSTGYRGELAPSFWWHRYQDRLDDMPDEISASASEVEKLLGQLGDGLPDSPRPKIAQTLEALDAFCQEQPDHKFSSEFGAQLANRRPITPGYMIVTPLDVKRFGILKECLGSVSFGDVLRPSGRGNPLDDWASIIGELKNDQWPEKADKKAERALIDNIKKILVAQ